MNDTQKRIETLNDRRIGAASMYRRIDDEFKELSEKSAKMMEKLEAYRQYMAEVSDEISELQSEL